MQELIEDLAEQRRRAEAAAAGEAVALAEHGSLRRRFEHAAAAAAAAEQESDELRSALASLEDHLVESQQRDAEVSSLCCTNLATRRGITIAGLILLGTKW